MRAMLSIKLDEKSAAEQDDFAETHELTVIGKDDSMSCNQLHAKRLDEGALPSLAEHQMYGKGKTKCCQCAYNSGYQQGSLLQNFISLDIDSLGDAPENTNGQYKSIHQAFAMGYTDGVNSFIRS